MPLVTRFVPILMVSVLLAGGSAVADPAAVDYDFVRQADIVEAALSLGEDEAKALAAAISAIPIDDRAPRYAIEGYRYAGRGGQLQEALIAAIASALRAGYPDDVDDFINEINEKELIRGLLFAREGGPHAVRLSLRTTGGKRSLVLARLFENGRSVTFTRAFSLCPRDPDARYTPDGERYRERRFLDGRPASERTLLCDEERGEWRQDGPWTEWDRTGVMRVQGEFLDGERSGVWRFHDEKGRLRRQSHFQAGREIERTEYLLNDAGKPWREETRRTEAGSESRSVVEWDYHPEGGPRSVKRYRDGYRDGEWMLWDAAGKVADRIVYRKGVAFPPEPGDNPSHRQVYRLFTAVAEADAFDAAALAPYASDLTPEDRETFSRLVFAALHHSDDGHPEIFERLYLAVIEFAPDSPLAHNAYWRLANLYRQAFDSPRLEAIVGLMERFLARYQGSDVLSLEKYPDAMLVFSPVRALHQAYEELGRFEPIAAYYANQVKSGGTMKDQDCLDYADALERLDRKAEAAQWYRRYLDRHTERDYSRAHAEERLKALGR